MITKQCPRCNKWVAEEAESYSSFSKGTTSNLKTAAKISCKAATAFDFIPGGRIVGALLSGLTQAGIDALAGHYRYHCRSCGYKWND